MPERVPACSAGSRSALALFPLALPLEEGNFKCLGFIEDDCIVDCTTSVMHANWIQNVCCVYLQGHRPVLIPVPLLNEIGGQEESSCPWHPSMIDGAVFKCLDTKTHLT